MDFISSAILGGVLYDYLKSSAVLSKEYLKDKLSDWVLEDSTAERIVEQVNYLHAEDKASACAANLIDKIDNSPTWQSIMQEIKPVMVANNQGIVADKIEAKVVVGRNEGGFHFYEAHEAKPEKKH